MNQCCPDNCKLKVKLAGETQDVSFEQPIENIILNGETLSNVHDLASKVTRMTKTIKVLAITALTLCVMAVGMALFTTHWLLSHESSIEQLLLTGNTEYNEMTSQARKWRSHQRHRAYVHLEEFHGLHWDDGMQDWVTHAMVKANKRN